MKLLMAHFSCNLEFHNFENDHVMSRFDTFTDAALINIVCITT